MPRVMPLLILALLASPAFAQTDPVSCAAISGDTARLACYDAIFPPVSGDTDVPPPIVVNSQQLIPARPTGRQPATITLACVDGSLTAAFGFAGQLLSNSGDNAPLSFQPDLGSTTVRNLPVTPENTAAVLRTTAETAAFLDTLQGARTLRIRVTPLGSRSLTVDFAWRDMAAVVTALREACR